MQTKINLIALPILAALLLAGCCSTDNIAKPSNITLVNALKQVGSGLAELKAAELETVATNQYLKAKYPNGDFTTGIFPSEVDVTFNVAASTSSSDQLTIDLNGSAPGVPVSGGISNTSSSSSTASRGNQITLKFMSALFTTTTTTATNGTKVVVGITDPATLTNFLNAVKAQGISQTLE